MAMFLGCKDMQHAFRNPNLLQIIHGQTKFLLAGKSPGNSGFGRKALQI